MNQLYKRLNRRKVSRKAGTGTANECPPATSGSLASPQSLGVLGVEVPVVDPVKFKGGKDRGKHQHQQKPAVESAVTSNCKPVKRSRIRKLLSAATSSSTTTTTTSRSIPSTRPTPLPRTPKTDPIHTPWERGTYWGSRPPAADPLHSLQAIASDSTSTGTISSTTGTPACHTPTRTRPPTHSHSHSTPPRHPGLVSSLSPSIPRSALAMALASLEHDPLVRWALDETANNKDDCDDKDKDKEEVDINDPAYVRNRIQQAAAALDKSGNNLFERGEYDQAFERYSKALALKKKTLHDASSSSSSSSPAKKQQEPQQDQDDQPQEEDKQDQQEKSIMASLATSINNTALLKQRAGHASPEETMASYLKSLQIKRDILGPDHLSVGKTLNNIGSVFYLKREFEPALAAYKDACRIMTAQLGSEHLDVGTVICNIGDVYCATGVTKEALEQYRRALPIRWKNLGPNDPKVVRLMEQISSLEMGKLPQKEEDHLSDSEGEEFAEEDRQRHSNFKEDLRVLQRELAEDMKFFDLMEREAAIDMVKDKTRVFRELRELANPPVENQKVRLPRYAPSAAVLSQPFPQPLALHHQPLLATPVEDAIMFPQKLESVENASEPTQQLEPDRVPVGEKQRAAALLSNEQRQYALSSVRERLAKLRASRGYEGSGLVGDGAPTTTRPVARRSYMEPTASSFAKTTTPTRLFLGTPERKKVNEGINNLRNTSNSNRHTTTTA